MKKIVDYLYIFSKLSTSFILLLILIIFGYFFYISFKNQDKSDDLKSEIVEKYNQNSQKLSQLSKKIETTETSLDKIKKFIENKNNTNNSDEIILLNNKIKKLDANIENILNSLKEIQNIKTFKTNKAVENESLKPLIDKNKLEMAELVIYKFENNLDFIQELDLLQKLNTNSNQYIFEKINLIRFEEFRGNSYLKKIYSQELDKYLKQKFNKNNNNFISESLMRFVLIEPSKKNVIKNNTINLLNEINTHLYEKKYKIAYKKIVSINNYAEYFKETASQIKIANEFKELIEKAI